MAETISEKKRILLVVAYDGTEYSGFQAQKSGARTIEGELNKALLAMTGENIEVIGASRTDAGVHALCNVAVFDTRSRIPAEKFAYALNVRLPADIRVQGSMEVPAGFHPRHQNTVKTYEYHIYNARQPLPVKSRFTHFSYTPYDVQKMRSAAAWLVGEHDFKSFCSVYTQSLTTVRTITDIQVEEIPIPVHGILAVTQTTQNAVYPDNETNLDNEMNPNKGLQQYKALQPVYAVPPDNETYQYKTLKPGNETYQDKTLKPDNEAYLYKASCDNSTHQYDELPKSKAASPAHFPREIIIRVSGTGFLYNMVRIIAGTLMEAGRGKIAPEEIPDILAACDRTKAGPTAPARGLILTNYEFLP